jgi:S-adenosylmethionine hydrolase
VLIGPDNGLLLPAAERLGGAVRAYELRNPAHRLPAVSASFHGRDIFSPAAAHVAAGVDVTDLGPELAPASLCSLDLPAPTVGDGMLTAAVLYADRYGSLILGAEKHHLDEALGPTPYGTPLEITWTTPGDEPHTLILPFEETFGKVPRGEALLWVDSSEWLGLAVNQGSAADRFGLADGAVLTVRRAPDQEG